MPQNRLIAGFEWNFNEKLLHDDKFDSEVERLSKRRQNGELGCARNRKQWKRKLVHSFLEAFDDRLICWEVSQPYAYTIEFYLQDRKAVLEFPRNVYASWCARQCRVGVRVTWTDVIWPHNWLIFSIPYAVFHASSHVNIDQMMQGTRESSAPCHNLTISGSCFLRLAIPPLGAHKPQIKCNSRERASRESSHIRGNKIL